MFELLKSGGWLVIPIMICSLVALTIVCERMWILRRSRIVPRHLVAQVWTWLRGDELDREKLKELRDSSYLGEILAAGLTGPLDNRDMIKERMEESGRQVVIRLEHYLNMLGTISLITPLLGLLGTVVGMIEVFNVITTQGVGNANALADGISQALVTTAVGLSIAIPSVIFHRFFHRRVDELVVTLEQEALKLVDAIISNPEYFRRAES